MEEIVVGIDVGTTKVCTLVGRVEDNKTIRIMGVGIEPSEGIKKGIIVDLAAASQAITRSVKKAESTSGLEITSALVSIAGAHVSSVNSRGAAAVNGNVIEQFDIEHAMEQARAVAIPYDREIIHVIQRGFSVDGQDGIRNPKGMHGYRLEVEAHIITASAATVDNLRQCVGAAGVEIQQFVLNPLASGEVLGLPIRTAQPENLLGLVDRLNSPAYSTGVGLLRWALSMHDQDLSIGRERRSKGDKRMDFGVVKKWIGRILP